MHRVSALTAFAAFVVCLAGCGGGDSPSTLAGGGSGSSGGGGGTTTGNGGTTTQTPVYSMGNGSGGGFQSGMIALSSSSISAGGSTSLTVSIVDQTGTLYAQSATITFNSPCIAAGTAAIQPQAAVTTTTGVATATYVAKGCSGTDDISASASVGGAVLTASATVTVAQASIGSIAFVSATPNNIALKGTGQSGHPESSTVVFQVLDSSGGPRSGAMVNFSLDSQLGGITLTPANATATSDAQGNVQVVVNAGTVATSVKVTASVAGNSQLSTQSSELTITTGVPTANNFSVAVGCYNIEGWDLDGIQTTVTARLSDRFQNPVPDGTAVTFHAKGAKIGSQCLTQTVNAGKSNEEGGVCSVSFTSQAFRPSDGRIPIIANAIGEESFNDANGNGSFDAGETFTDTQEPFEDDAQTGTFQSGDFFYDFNNNGTHDGPDGQFNGVLCNDSAHCSGPKSVGIGAQNTIILSGSTPVVDLLDGNGNVISGPISSAGGTVILWVRDVNGNAMPGNTSVSGAAAGNSPASYSISGSSSFTVPCTAQPANLKASGTTVFVFNVSASTPGTGTFSLTVKTPSGRSTVVPIPIG